MQWTTCNVHCCSECTECVSSKAGLTCCAKGGSWEGKCGRPGDTRFEHTWGEGLKGCAKRAALGKGSKGVTQEKEDRLSPLTQTAIVSASSIVSTINQMTVMMALIYCIMMFS